MCRMASFFHKPGTDEVVVYNLNSHSVTERKLKLDLNEWDEGHYLPNGTIEARVKPSSRHSQEECSANIKARFPSFIQFLNWAFTQALSENLDLRGLTSTKGLKLPSTVGGDLYLNKLTRAEIEKLNLSDEMKAKVMR